MKTVIEMAREAGLLGPYDTEQDIVECGIEVWLSGELGMKAIEHFAEIVRADEREKYKWDIHSCGPTCKRYACVATREAIAAEREAVLDLVDDYAKGNTDLRDAIRARGQV